MQPRPPSVRVVVSGIYQAGRQPVLLAPSRPELTPYGGVVKEIMRLRTRKDSRDKTSAPLRTRALAISVWMSEPR
jgi:hypothetical protein